MYEDLHERFELIGFTTAVLFTDDARSIDHDALDENLATMEAVGANLLDALDTVDWDRARELQRALRPLEDLCEEPGAGSTPSAGNNAPVIKRGLELVELNGGPVRDPLVGLSAEDEARLEVVYAHLGVTSLDA